LALRPLNTRWLLESDGANQNGADTADRDSVDQRRSRAVQRPERTRDFVQVLHTVNAWHNDASQNSQFAANWTPCQKFLEQSAAPHCPAAMTSVEVKDKFVREDQFLDISIDFKVPEKLRQGEPAGLVLLVLRAYRDAAK
jgi:hypothetical protein